MGKILRLASATALALVAACSLAGCAPVSPGAFTRTVAEADTAQWTSQAVTAIDSVHSGAKGITKVNDFEVCRTDHGYFATSSQWRTISTIGVPLKAQNAALGAVRDQFVADHWTASEPDGILTLKGPSDAKLRGVLTLQSTSDTELSLTAISPCYK